ncbi:hypothetical protein GOARA_021_01440 [Gordonia araii NBRC 100433]|uniref:Uncharacterized protein n=1 Tax=Gordonia araii NBRC 100433 TaxID=1073574 RepID=G7GZ81_9ACTN|nr:hypothetical protein [Gordonia araii]NNG97114.1 hypothetical protein [Gordonia araii NBRC 100433]GAB08906.1 hypothetical protein GOARA_021_01440 [Gordonia araii NBRC 100433]
MTDIDVAAHIRVVVAETVAEIDAVERVGRTHTVEAMTGVPESPAGVENQVAGSSSRRLLHPAAWWA